VGQEGGAHGFLIAEREGSRGYTQVYMDMPMYVERMPMYVCM